MVDGLEAPGHGAQEVESGAGEAGVGLWWLLYDSELQYGRANAACFLLAMEGLREGKREN